MGFRVLHSFDGGGGGTVGREVEIGESEVSKLIFLAYHLKVHGFVCIKRNHFSPALRFMDFMAT